MKDFSDSIFSTIKERFRNPFLGTLLFVLIFRNWEVIYSIFNFDNDCNLEDKIHIIKSFYFNKNIYTELATNVLVTICVLIFTFTMLSISRFIVDFYYKRIEKWIIKTVDKVQIANRSDIETVNLKYKEILNRYDILDKEKIELQNYNSRIQDEKKKLIHKNITLDELNTKITNDSVTLDIKNKELSNEVENINLKFLKEINNLENVINAYNFREKEYISRILELSKDGHYDYNEVENKIDTIKKLFPLNNIDNDKTSDLTAKFFKIYTKFNNEDLVNFMKIREKKEILKNEISSSLLTLLFDAGIIKDVPNGTYKIKLGNNGIKFLNYIERFNDENLKIKRN
jgi:hypothetical protein